MLPCQPFTKLSRKELSESRKAGRERDSNLLTEAAKFVKRFRPEMVLSENVQGIGDPKYGGVWDDFRVQLGKLGYATGSKVVCTSNFGIPQFRRRSILVAVRRELANPAFLSTGHMSDLIVPEAAPDNAVTTVQAAIGHLPPLTAGETDSNIPNHKTRSLSDLNLKRLSAALPGMSNVYMEDTPDGDLSLACHRKVNAKLRTRCFNDVYTRISPDRPSPTITTKCHSISNGRFGNSTWNELRRILSAQGRDTPVVSRRLCFLSYRHDRTYRFRMIGNAVPPKLAEFFSRQLAASIRANGRSGCSGDHRRIGRPAWLRKSRSTPQPHRGHPTFRSRRGRGRSTTSAAWPIADAPTAVSEIWKNAWDAYATNVSLNIFDGAKVVAAESSTTELGCRPPTSSTDGW